MSRPTELFKRSLTPDLQVFAINPENTTRLAQFKANAARSAIVSVPPTGWASTGTAETTAAGFNYSHNPVTNSASRYGPLSSLPFMLLVIVSFLG